MAAPSNPTATELCNEGLYKAGYNTTGAAAKLTRASGTWLEEIKNDIYTMSRTLKSLVDTYVHITVQNQSRYDMPDDYEETISMVLMDAVFYGTAQTGGTASLTLGSTETATEEDVEGHEVVIYAGTDINESAQCLTYDETTKIATFPAGSFTASPDSTSKYFITSDQDPLQYMGISEYDKRAADTTVRNEPLAYTIKENATFGEFYLYPAPYRSSGLTVYGVKQRYYANITRVDTSGTLISTLYRKWRNTFVQGIFAKALQDMDDTRAKAEMSVYYTLLKTLIAKESPAPETDDFIRPAISG